MECITFTCDTGSKHLFEFRSGTHGLNKELGRHRGREGKIVFFVWG